MPSPAQVYWTFTTPTARDANVVLPVEVGCWCMVLSTGLLHQAIGAGAGSSKWSQASDNELDASNVTNDSGVTGAAVSDALNNLSPSARAFQTLGLAPLSTGLTMIDDKAYWSYMGYFPSAVTVKFVRFWLVTGGTGAQTAEVALASGTAPNRGNQTLTKIGANGTLGDLTGAAGVLGNTVSMAQAVAAGTHLWAGIRPHLASTQPVLYAVANDMGQGRLCATTTAGALTGNGPWTGTVISAAVTAQAPLLLVTLD